MSYIIRIFVLIFILTSCNYSLHNPFIIIIENNSLKILGDVRVTNFNDDSSCSSLVWTGTEYGVCWIDFREGIYQIYFARINSLGNKIGSDVRITNDINDRCFPSLVWTGTEYGVLWQDARNGSDDIYFVRIDASGGKIGSEINIVNDLNSSNNPSLVWTGTEYGLSWHDNRDSNNEIYFTRIDAAGGKIGSDTRITNSINESWFPSLVWTGIEYGLSWSDARDGGNYEIYFTRISAAGGKIGSDIRITNDINFSTYPSLVWTGTEYGISWFDTRDSNNEIYFVRVDASGSKIGSDIRITNDSNDSFFPSLVWTGTEYGISWSDNRDGNYEIYFARVNAAGSKIGSDTRITNFVNDSYSPSIVWTGTEYGVSWEDGRDGNNEIYFVKLNSAGKKQ